jgi:hypothetical protein
VGAADESKAVDIERYSRDPIVGYGDFSDQEYASIDWTEVVRLQVQCANDNGFPVQILPSGDGYNFAGIPLEQHREASEIMDACLHGLDLPDPVLYTDEQLIELYGYLLEVKACLENEGYTVSEPPSVTAFVDNYGGAWHPHESIPLGALSAGEWIRLQEACPPPRRSAHTEALHRLAPSGDSGLVAFDDLLLVELCEGCAAALLCFQLL